MPSAPTALIVETDAEVRDVLTLVLREAGYTVVEYATDDAALAALQAGLPATILVTEVWLPGLDGWQLAYAARRLRPGLPILYIPALDEGSGLQVPQSFVLPKPFGARTLAVAVRLMVSPAVIYH